MSWTIAAIAVALAVSAAAGVVVLRKKAAGRNRTIGWGAPIAVADAEAGAGHGFYGLSSHDAAQLQRLAREQMHREQAEWGRDYLPTVTADTRPGRLSGIPRALRVRR